MHGGVLTRPGYRPDIDGLRAVAVAAVVVYHAFPDALPGGFAGVDVFFVISGYLITRILAGELSTGRFTLAGFYARRIRRILPALAVVLLACLCAGWFMLDPDDYRSLGAHAVAGVLFVPNLLLWQEAGYFDQAASLKPLLHLWSLGIEEQFYLAWPLALWLGWRAKMPLLPMVLAAAVASFVACELMLRQSPDAAFYLPHARAWELMLGAALAARAGDGASIGTPRRARLAGAAGLALVLGSFAWLDEAAPFPGHAALAPTLGAALLIMAGSQAWPGRRLLGHPLAVFVGRISYPLYLWHWPLLAMVRVAAPEWLTPSVRVLLVLSSVVLAWATWRFVEEPVRRGTPQRWKIVVPVAGMVLAAALGLAVHAREGFVSRVDVDVRRYASYAYDPADGARVGSCWLAARAPADGFGGDCVDREPAGRPLVVVWGDSHAARLAVGVRAVGEGRYRVAQFTRDGCPPLFALRYPRCLESNAHVLERVRDLRPDHVVLFAFWNSPTLPDLDALLAELDRTIAELQAAGVPRVLLVGPAMQWDGLERTLPKNLLRLHREAPYLRAPARMVYGTNPVAAERDARFAMHFAHRTDVDWFSAHSAQCDARGCITRTGNDPFDLATWDYGHLTRSGAVHLAQRLEAAAGGFDRAP